MVLVAAIGAQQDEQPWPRASFLLQRRVVDHRRRRGRHERRLSPRRTRRTRRCPARSRRVDQRLDVPLGRARRAAARRPDAHPDEHVLGRALPPPATRRERRSAGRRAAASSSLRVPERLEEIRRQISWARTYDLPLARDLGARGGGALPADRHSTASSGRPISSPTATSTRPSCVTRWRTWPARAEPGSSNARRVLGIDVRQRSGSLGTHRPRRHRVRGRRQLRRHVRRRDRPAGRRADPARPDVAPVSRHRAVPRTGSIRRCRRCATPTCSSTSAKRSTAWSWAATSATPHRGRPTAHSYDAIPADFNGRLLPEDWPRFEADRRRTPHSGCRRWPSLGIRKIINGPEAFTPDNEFCLGETEVAGLFVAAGFCAHGIAGAGGIGKVMAEWIVAGEPSFDVWHMDINRFGRSTARPSYTLAAHGRELPDLLRHPVPGTAANRGPAAATCRRPTAGTRAPRRSSARRPAGNGSTATRATPGKGTSRCDREAGRVATGRRRSAPSTSRTRATRRAVRRIVVRQDRGQRPRRSRPPGVGVRQRRRPRRSASITYTQALNSRGGIECDFTVTRTCDDVFLIVTGTAFGTHDMAWLRRQARRRECPSANRRRHRAFCVLRAVGAALARHPRPAHAGCPGQRRVPVHDRRRADGRRRPRRVRCA